MTLRLPLKLTAVLAAGLSLLAACGGDDDDAGSGEAGTRTVEITMRDIEFSPDSVEVAAGETVRFVFRNEGKAVHDAFIGDEEAQDEHEMEMRKGGDSGMDHGGGGDDEGGITVDPGKSGELTHTFRAGDRLLIGCHQPGHYDAGMKLEVTVT
jgi:uncharacterized cupredoxin-like copper-binding protein